VAAWQINGTTSNLTGARQDASAHDFFHLENDGLLRFGEECWRLYRSPAHDAAGGGARDQSVVDLIYGARHPDRALADNLEQFARQTGVVASNRRDGHRFIRAMQYGFSQATRSLSSPLSPQLVGIFW